MESLLVTVLLLLLVAASGQQIPPREDRSAGVVHVRVDRVVPRHLCRRALRNLEVSPCNLLESCMRSELVDLFAGKIRNKKNSSKIL